MVSHQVRRTDRLARLETSPNSSGWRGNEACQAPDYIQGELAIQFGDFDQALEDFGRLIELDPAFVDGYVNRAGVRYELGDELGVRADIDAGLLARRGPLRIRRCLRSRRLRRLWQHPRALTARTPNRGNPAL
jgi:tetratricopeptide (TPR) repeat protein